MRSHKNLNPETWQFLILIALCLLLFFFDLGVRPLWDVDEGMHAVTSKEMVLSGDWVTPTFNGQPFYDKPVLHNWLIALAFLVFGFTEFAARLPSALLGGGCVLLTYLLGRRMFAPTVGFLGGVILATSAEFIVLSRSVMHDSSLVFFVTLALYLFYVGFNDRRRKKPSLLLFYAALGMAVLAKGPVGLAIPAMVIGLYLIVEKKLAFVKQMQIGWGILIFLAVAAPWYVLIALADPDYAGYFFVKQNLGSFLSSDSRHPEPFYYYIPVLFGGFFPWSCFLPLALIDAIRRRLKTIKTGTAFIVIWFSVVFIFFSVAESKLATYLLPLFPAVSLLTAWICFELINGATVNIHKGFLISFLPVVAVLTAAMVYMWINPPVEIESEAGIPLSRVNLLVLLLVAAAVLSLALLLGKKYSAFFASTAGMMIIVLLFFLFRIAPMVNPYRSTKELARTYDRLIPPDERLVFYRRIKDSALFYTHRKASVLADPEQLKAYLTADKRVYCIISRKRLAEQKLMPYVVECQGDSLLISNKKQS